MDEKSGNNQRHKEGAENKVPPNENYNGRKIHNLMAKVAGKSQAQTSESPKKLAQHNLEDFYEVGDLTKLFQKTVAHYKKVFDDSELLGFDMTPWEMQNTSF